jgi:hypothetical protein
MYAIEYFQTSIQTQFDIQFKFEISWLVIKSSTCHDQWSLSENQSIQYHY